MTITQCLEMNNEVFIAYKHNRLGWCKGEVQESDYWAGGDPGGWTNDSNIYFDSIAEVEGYYRQFAEVHVFEDEYDCDNFLDGMEE